MSRNMILIISVFILGTIAIIGCFWVLKSVFSDEEAKEISAKARKITSQERKAIDKKSQTKRTMDPREEQPLGITEAIGKFEEEKRKESGSASVYKTGQKRFQRLADKAAEEMEVDNRSDGWKSKSENFKEMSKRKAQENKVRLEKAEREGKYIPSQD